MSQFVELWVYMSDTPLFALALTLLVYTVSSWIYGRCGQSPLLNPVLLSIVILGLVLSLGDIAYESYFSGAQFIHFLLGPAVVALAYPLWLRRKQLRERGRLLLISALAGGFAAAGSAVLLSWLLKMPIGVVLSLAPKSVTTPVGMGIAEKIQADPALTALFIILTGLVGVLTGPYLFRLLRIPKNEIGWIAQGFALGTAAHGIGAARALQVNEDAGAYAGLAMGLQAVLAALVIPLLMA